MSGGILGPDKRVRSRRGRSIEAAYQEAGVGPARQGVTTVRIVHGSLIRQVEQLGRMSLAMIAGADNAASNRLYRPVIFACCKQNVAQRSLEGSLSRESSISVLCRNWPKSCRILHPRFL